MYIKMELDKTSLLFLVFLVLVVVRIDAKISDHEHDEFWQKRSEEARHRARMAYEAQPELVVSHLNQHAHNSTQEMDARRELLGRSRIGGPKGGGGCAATNPIDHCWRCDKNWAQNRKRLADCALGFGRRTTGGKAGKFYTVTDPSDNDMMNPKPGTLRHALIQPQPLWVIFARNMNIKLNNELIMAGDKTIDGRGAVVHIANGAGLTLQFIHNVIIHGIHVHDIKVGNGGTIRDSVGHFGTRGKSDGDGINIFGSTNIWIDHLSMSNCYDGLIDAVQGSTAITVSNCFFTHHYEALLFGASDSSKEDAVMQITLAFNHFGEGISQRMPRVRWGFAHIVNNDYTHWLLYAIGGSSHPTILSQGNRFDAAANPNTKEVTKRDYAPKSVWQNWVWKSEQDIFLSGAFFVQSGNPKHVFPKGQDMIPPKPGQFAAIFTKFAGALKCIPKRPC